MSKVMRRSVFERAIKKLYGERLITEKQDFEEAVETSVLNMVKRTAKQNGGDYEALTTVYKPYVSTRSNFYFNTDSGCFAEELSHIFFNENTYVLDFEGAEIEVVRDFRENTVYRLITKNSYPYTDYEIFTASEKKEIVAIYKKYAAFMKEVVASACMIRDVINSAATTKQLAETSPELGALIPETESCVALVPIETVKKVSALFKRT